MSSVTRWIVSWIWRRNARPASVDGVGTVAALARSGGPSAGRLAPTTSSRWARTKRQTRLRNREAPSTPWSFHSRSFSGGAANSSKSRPVSAPYFSRIKSSDTTLPLDLDIFAPSLITIPWERRSEEHTSELQSQSNLVCRLLLEKKKRTICVNLFPFV